MDIQNHNQQNSGSLGQFFPSTTKFEQPKLSDLYSLKFRGSRLDLQVYHLAYGTKKLRACTYSRMKKRQQKKNQKKARLQLTRSPEQIAEKAEKEAWLRGVQKVVKDEELQTVEPIISLPPKRAKNHKQKKQKKIRKLKEKISGKTYTPIIHKSKSLNNGTKSVKIIKRTLPQIGQTRLGNNIAPSVSSVTVPAANGPSNSSRPRDSGFRVNDADFPSL